MKTNITLIGMPGAGKSTVGIILAKNLAYGFIDTDVLIQINRQKSLQDILDESDYLNLRKIEEQEVFKININTHIISTGGSVVYSDKAMSHLCDISTIVFLKISYSVMQQRVHNLETRGIAKADRQSYQDLFDERQSLYEKYAELSVDCDQPDQEDLARIIILELPDAYQGKDHGEF